MKRSLVCFFFAALLAGCGNSNSGSAESKPPAPKDPEVEKGLALVAAHGCSSCHQGDQQPPGPAYTAVAAKYPANAQVIDSLAQKIIKGGAGNWGTVTMIAHPNVSQED